MSNNTTPAAPVTDAQLVVDLTNVLDAVKAELAELEPRRAALAARVVALEATIAVYSGNSDAVVAPKPAAKRRAKREPGQPTVREQRAAKKAAKEAAEAAAAAQAAA